MLYSSSHMLRWQPFQFITAHQYELISDSSENLVLAKKKKQPTKQTKTHPSDLCLMVSSVMLWLTLGPLLHLVCKTACTNCLALVWTNPTLQQPNPVLKTISSILMWKCGIHYSKRIFRAIYLHSIPMRWVRNAEATSFHHWTVLKHLFS